MGLLMIWNDVWSFASMECVRSWSSGIFWRWIWRWAMGSSSVWGDIWSFAVMEYVQSCGLGIFQREWPKIVFPYTHESDWTQLECVRQCKLLFWSWDGHFVSIQALLNGVVMSQ